MAGGYYFRLGRCVQGSEWGRRIDRRNDLPPDSVGCSRAVGRRDDFHLSRSWWVDLVGVMGSHDVAGGDGAAGGVYVGVAVLGDVSSCACVRVYRVVDKVRVGTAVQLAICGAEFGAHVFSFGGTRGDVSTLGIPATSVAERLNGQLLWYNPVGACLDGDSGVGSCDGGAAGDCCCAGSRVGAVGGGCGDCGV